MESGSATKRRGWLLTKAREVALRNDDQVGLIIFSSSGKMSKYCSPNSSMLQIIDRFKKASGTQIEEDDDKQIYRDMTRMKNENDKLQATVGQLTGEDLTTLTKEGLTQLKKQLQVSIDRIGSRELELLQAELAMLQWRRILEAELSRAREEKETEKTEQSRDLLQVSPRFSNGLQPTQPNLEDPNLHHHACSSGNMKKPKHEGCPADDEMSGMML